MFSYWLRYYPTRIYDTWSKANWPNLLIKWKQTEKKKKLNKKVMGSLCGKWTFSVYNHNLKENEKTQAKTKKQQQLQQQKRN